MTQSAFAFGHDNGISAQWCETPPFSSTSASRIASARCYRVLVVRMIDISAVLAAPSTSKSRGVHKVLIRRVVGFARA